jgi:hypothetical protein
MARQVIAEDGTLWQVTLSGRYTQYARDEVSLEFCTGDSERSERRYVRFAPRGARSAERAYEEASDGLLRRLLAVSQPAWTSPDGAYGSRV